MDVDERFAHTVQRIEGKTGLNEYGKDTGQDAIDVVDGVYDDEEPEKGILEAYALSLEE